MAILSNLLVNGASRLLGKLYCDGETTITGLLVINNQTETSNTSYTGPALSVGAINAKHVEYSYDCIQAKNKETAAANLWLNYYGGRVYLSNGNLIYADNGTFKVPTVNVTTSATIASANITNGSVTTLRSGSGTFDNLNVVNTLRSNKWDVQSVANLGGSFYIAPTLNFPNNSNTTLTVTKSSSALSLTINDSTLTSEKMAGITWTVNSEVKVSGTINGVVTGTMGGIITAVPNSSSHVLTVSVMGGNWSNVSAGEYNATQFSDLSVMVYQRSVNSNTYPVGIWVNCYDTSNDSATIKIYGGSDVKPNVMLGNLTRSELYTVNGMEPQGWGLFAQNAYLHGHIVANAGKIGGFTLGTESMYSGDNFPATNNFYLMPTGSQSTTYNIAGSGLLNNWVMTSGTTFGVTKDGKIYATAGKIGGFTLSAAYMYGNKTAPAADNLFLMPAGTSSSYTVAGVATTGWTITSGTTFGVTKAGAMYSTSGKIGGWTIGTSAIYNGVISMDDETHTGLYLGTDGIRNYNATTGNYVDIEKGIITAVGANIEGSVYADTGEIGGFSLSENGLIGTHMRMVTGQLYYQPDSYARLEIRSNNTDSTSNRLILSTNGIFYKKNVPQNGENWDTGSTGSYGLYCPFYASELNWIVYNHTISFHSYYDNDTYYTQIQGGDLYCHTIHCDNIAMGSIYQTFHDSIVRKFTSSNQTFKVGSRYDIPITTLTGYTATNMISIVSSGFVASFYGYISGDHIECWCAAARNVANGSNAGTGTIEVYVLYIK